MHVARLCAIMGVGPGSSATSHTATYWLCLPSLKEYEAVTDREIHPIDSVLSAVNLLARPRLAKFTEGGFKVFVVVFVEQNK